ncbi:MAG: PAAR domain-containing protein [Phormidium sp.]
MGRPAARITDSVAHPLPQILTGGPGSPNVFIGNLPAWRGIRKAAVAAIQSAKQSSDIAIRAAEAANIAAKGTPAQPATEITEQTTKITSSITMSNMIISSAAGADIHNCSTPLPIPPHGPGVVIDGSNTVLINGLPGCRQGDTILEALGPPNKIIRGCLTVLIGG